MFSHHVMPSLTSLATPKSETSPQSLTKVHTDFLCPWSRGRARRALCLAHRSGLAQPGSLARAEVTPAAGGRRMTRLGGACTVGKHSARALEAGRQHTWGTEPAGPGLPLRPHTGAGSSPHESVHVQNSGNSVRDRLLGLTAQHGRYLWALGHKGLRSSPGPATTGI